MEDCYRLNRLVFKSVTSQLGYRTELSNQFKDCSLRVLHKRNIFNKISENIQIEDLNDKNRFLHVKSQNLFIEVLKKCMIKFKIL